MFLATPSERIASSLTLVLQLHTANIFPGNNAAAYTVLCGASSSSWGAPGIRTQSLQRRQAQLVGKARGVGETQVVEEKRRC